jgi:hypothetical protein
MGKKLILSISPEFAGILLNNYEKRVTLSIGAIGRVGGRSGASPNL